MNFSDAIDALKAGLAVRRIGWTTGSFLYFLPADTMSASSTAVRQGLDAQSRFGGRIALKGGAETESQHMWKITAEDDSATDWEILAPEDTGR